MPVNILVDGYINNKILNYEIIVKIDQKNIKNYTFIDYNCCKNMFFLIKYFVVMIVIVKLGL